MGRGGIVCRNVEHMVLVLKCIQDAVNKKEIEIIRIKNRFIEPRNEGTGYRDIQFNIRFIDPVKVAVIKIIRDSGHDGDNKSDALLTGTLYNNNIKVVNMLYLILVKLLNVVDLILHIIQKMLQLIHLIYKLLMI